ncbi:MAG: FAD-dependent oxidoreductase [Tetrasphaera sp.]
MGSGPLWWQPYAAAAQPDSAAVALDRSVDVAIVGGGYTGLWTAYYLLRERPDLSVLVLEAEHVGFGASGRNGGWVSALFPLGADSLAAKHGREATARFLAELRHTVDEVGDIVAAEGIAEAGFVKGGVLSLARGPAHVARAQTEVEAGEVWGEGTVWLSAAQTRERMVASDVDGATWNPHCARVQPRALVEGLAWAVRARGGVIGEGCRVRDARSGSVELADGRAVRARHVIRATEAYTAGLPRLRRRIVPVYSLMVATEPLSESLWATIGLDRREVFTDFRHLRIYGQRTVDDRIAFGGRGAPYHFGSTVRAEFDLDERVFALLKATLREVLPQLGDVRFTHAWGGPLGIPRDWHASVGYDPHARVGRAGGYVGDGVAVTNLAGRTLADLVLGRQTAVTRLPWVGHRSPTWEPEPLRWLGVNAGLRLAAIADAEERLTGRPARSGRLLAALTGH